MYCPNCGCYNDENAAFCGSCGTHLRTEQSGREQPGQTAGAVPPYPGGQEMKRMEGGAPTPACSEEKEREKNMADTGGGARCYRRSRGRGIPVDPASAEGETV